jgi:hypothetical protein
MSEIKSTQKNPAEIEAIIQRLGFDRCDGEPEDACDICERCHRIPEALYFRGPVDEEEYCCQDCIMEEHQKDEECNRIMKEALRTGHSNRCAMFQSLAGGECECNKMPKSHRILVRPIESVEPSHE